METEPKSAAGRAFGKKPGREALAFAAWRRNGILRLMDPSSQIKILFSMTGRPRCQDETGARRGACLLQQPLLLMLSGGDGRLLHRKVII